ncbi:hypothetical protein AAA536_07960 [Pseudomonas aeruginosa]
MNRAEISNVFLDLMDSFKRLFYVSINDFPQDPATLKSIESFIHFYCQEATVTIDNDGLVEICFGDGECCCDGFYIDLIRCLISDELKSIIRRQEETMSEEILQLIENYLTNGCGFAFC